jgi:hypothetical protein
VLLTPPISRSSTILLKDMVAFCKGAHGTVAKATSWGAPPTQGSIPGCCTICGKIKKNPRQSRVPKQRDGPGRLHGRVWSRQESHGLCFPVSGRGRGSEFFLACVRRPSSYMQCPGAACSSQVDFFYGSFLI